MVQIIVHMSDRGSEWGLVELQGELETRDQIPFDSMHIGDLHFDCVRGMPSLIVGHHLLTGKVVDLEKPFAVLRKKSAAHVQRDHCAWSNSGMELESGIGMQVEHKNTEYEVIAIIKKKIIFKNRPKPIITKPLPKRM